MTAANIFKHRDRVVMVADGAYYDGDGQIIRIASKVHTLPQLKLAILVEGFGEADFLRWFFEKAVPTDLPSALRSLPAASQALAGDRTKSPFLRDGSDNEHRMMIGAWDDQRGGGHTWLLSSDHHGMPHGYQPHTLMPISGFANLQVPAVARMNRERSEDVENALRLLNEQRSVPDSLGVVVGGFGELVTIDPAGVRRQVIQRWDDDYAACPADSTFEPEAS